HAPPHDATALGLGSDHEPGHVDEVDDRQVEGAAQVGEADLLLGRRRVQRARQVHRVVADQSHGDAVDPRERRDDRAAPLGPHLEERVPVDDLGHRVAHPVRAATVLRDDVQDRVAGPVYGVGAIAARRELPDVLRQVPQDGADLADRLVLVGDQVVDRSRHRGVHRGAAELVLVDLLAQRTPYDRGAAGEHDAAGADDAEVAQHRAAGRAARGRAEHTHQHRDLAEQVKAALPAHRADEVGVAHFVLCRDVAADAFHEHDQGDAITVREVLDEAAHAALVPVEVGLRGARAHREVLAAEGDLAAVDGRQAAHVAGGQAADLSAAGVPDAEAGELPHLGEGLGDGLDALADRLTALVVLAPHPLGSAERLRDPAVLGQLLQGALPGEAHDATSTTAVGPAQSAI